MKYQRTVAKCQLHPLASLVHLYEILKSITTHFATAPLHSQDISKQ